MTVGPGLHPPFDRELVDAVPRIREAVDAPLHAGGIAAARRRSTSAEIDDEAIQSLGFDIKIVRGIGRDVGAAPRLLVCRPRGATDRTGFLYHIHGGGMVAGSWRSEELAFDLKRARRFGLAVVSVDYRLAPDHPYPAALDDCVAQLAWLEDEGAALGLDPGRIVLSGNSAGGGLAAWVALRRKAEGRCAVTGAMLQCPMLDERCDTPSAQQMPEHGVWDTVSNRTGWTALLGRTGGPVLTPARHADLSGLPPVFIDVGSAESLRDEAVAFASRIWKAGGEAELHVWSGAFHSFDQWVPDATVSKAAEAARLQWLGRVLVT